MVVRQGSYLGVHFYRFWIYHCSYWVWSTALLGWGGKNPFLWR